LSETFTAAGRVVGIILQWWKLWNSRLWNKCVYWLLSE